MTCDTEVGPGPAKTATSYSLVNTTVKLIVFQNGKVEASEFEVPNRDNPFWNSHFAKKVSEFGEHRKNNAVMLRIETVPSAHILISKSWKGSVKVLMFRTGFSD